MSIDYEAEDTIGYLARQNKALKEQLRYCCDLLKPESTEPVERRRMEINDF